MADPVWPVGGGEGYGRECGLADAAGADGAGVEILWRILLALEHFTEPFEGAVLEGADGFFGFAELLGDFRVGKFAQEAEGEYFAVVAGEVQHGGADAGAVVFAIERFGGRGEAVVVDEFGGVVERGGGTALFDFVHRLVVGDAEEPGVELVGVAECGEVLPGEEEGLRGDVFGGVDVFEDGADVAGDGGDALVVEGFEGEFVGVLGPLHEIGERFFPGRGHGSQVGGEGLG